MAFDDTKNAYSQQHFTIIEIDLPVVNGTCTIGGSPGYGTPLTCDQDINGTFTYKFTMGSTPVLPISDVWRCIESINETPTELQSGRGLASRGTLSIRLADFIGDPNPLAPAVNESVKSQGTFFGKLDARNILQNREVRVKNYRMVDGVMPDLDNDAEVRHYIAESFKPNAGKWVLTAKDELSRVDLNEKVWPPVIGGFLRGNLTSSTTVIGVEPAGAYSLNDVIRVGDELMTVIEIIDPITVRVKARGSVIGTPEFSSVLSRTETPDSKDAGDEVFICRAYDAANIADLLFDVLTGVGMPEIYIPMPDWYNEIAIWHANTEVSTLFTEAEDVNEVLSNILQSYLLDLWFDPVDREIKLTAISAWQQSSASLTEGKEIDFDSVRREDQDNLRATTALVVYDKPFQARDNDTENFRKVSIFTNPVLESEKYYGESKDKSFENNSIIDDTAAQLLTQRYVSRYGITPQRYKATTQERFLSFKTGDVVDITTFSKQDFNGLPTSSARGQVISIKPNYRSEGRDYTVTALTYEPAFNTGTEVVVTGSVVNLNLFTRFVNSPSNQPVELTIIFDGVLSGSTAQEIPSIRTGEFPAGSKLIIILANGADLQSKGGNGAKGGSSEYDVESDSFINTQPTNGLNGGTVFDAQDVDCDIYFSGPTPSALYPVADGFIRAPGGGGGATAAVGAQNEAGDGGSGGAGREVGNGGEAGFVSDRNGVVVFGETGNDGNETGNGGDGVNLAGDGGGWGEDGQDAVSSGGLAGSGIIKGTATVQLFGDTPQRYISGNGDI